MRTIEFRGFNRKNKKWLYGYYLMNRGAHFVCPDEFAGGKSWTDYEADADTIGQFTGLLDKNRKKIYEGDIVAYATGRSVKGRLAVGVVVFSMCGYEIKVDALKPMSYLMTGFRDIDSYRLEVIGNIHDNPEILKFIKN